MKNILLTGASGSIGREALRELCTKTDRFSVHVFDVDNENARRIFRPYESKITLHYGDITNYADIEKACHNIDFVIHLAAIIPPLADHEPELAERVNAQGTKNIIKALETHSPKACILYSSSISLYGDRVGTPEIYVTDEIKPSLGDEYALTKIVAENAIKESKLRWSVFRLAAIMGASGDAKMDPLFFHMPLRTSFEICTSRDTGFAFVEAIDKFEQVESKVFNLGGGEKCRTDYETFIDTSFRIVGLGGLNMPENAFAQQNFHCGYYMDGHELNGILQFQRDSVADYFELVKATVPPFRKFITNLLRKKIQKMMVRQSDPMQAIENKDKEMLERFFLPKKAEELMNK